MHGGWRCGQTKALGRRSRHLLPGDRVDLEPVPMDEAEYEAYLRGEVRVRPERDFLVAMPEGGYLTVRSGTFVEWATAAYPGLAIFDGVGRPLLGEPVAADVEVVSLEARDCAACAAVRGGRLDAYRRQRAEAARSRKDEVAQRRAERARARFHSV